ncbi:hypothetical protein QMK33_21425 [Hymenobacter sp. H14-R3]|uniref:hypothetical protein n=1 Tax=Hymenobacter sp. H14-R3 TaxID=3046308 RepID=UPI0024B8E9AF|nr:hypothetical protein [Hymenobacter sp. H14-R3]MDJ0367715.1 hypothetical protein [Hymenobacter sp. H14-R3]
MKKNLLVFLGNLFIALPLWACPVCDKRQPKGFAGITHGVGPGGPFDYLMLYGSILVVLVTFGLFLRFLLLPESAHNLVRRRQLSSFL